MSDDSPSSIKSFYRAKVHNSNSNSVKSSYKRQPDSNENQPNTFKVPRPVEYEADVTLDASDDESPLTNEFLPIRGISTPYPGALPFGVEETFNTSGDPAKSRLFKIFFLKSRDSDVLRSAYNSLSREVFDPRWIDFTEIDKMISLQKYPVLVLDSFESDEFSRLKSKKSLKIFSAFALLSIHPRKPENLIFYKNSHIASICMRKVSLTFSGITDHSVVKELKYKTRAMGGVFRPGLHAKTTHIVATHWNSEKVKYFRKVNKPVMRPEWIFRCWEKREDILDIQELDNYTLPVFAGMNICVSGFDSRTRTKIRQNVEANGGNWQSGLLLNRYDFDSEDTKSTQIDPVKKTTHLVVAAKQGDKYKAAMSDPDVKIVNIDWVNDSQTLRIPQMEDDPKYCLRDNSAANELKRLEIERKRKQLQSCSQNAATVGITEDNPSPVLPPKKDNFTIIEKLASTNMISSTDVFDGLSFCFCGLGTNYHQNVKKLISRLGGIVYNELVAAVTHVIIGPNMTSRDAYNLNRHEEKYRSISKVNLDWVTKCADNGKLFPPYIDDKLESFLGQITCTQDLPPNEAKEIAYARALKSADEFTKEIDIGVKLIQNSNTAKNNNNDQTTSKNGFRMGAIPVTQKLKITKDHRSKRVSNSSTSIPVGWGSQPID